MNARCGSRTPPADRAAMVWVCAAALAAGACAAPPAAPPVADDRIAAAWRFDEARQFDFWVGQWSAAWHMVSPEGVLTEVDRTAHRVFPVLRGKALIELVDGVPRPDGDVTRGFSIRYYDRAASRWKMAQSWPRTGLVGFSSLAGNFRHGRGEMFREIGSGEGEPYTVRYTFSDVHPERFRWDSAYRLGGESGWTIDAITEFTREAPGAGWPVVGAPFPTAGEGAICPDPESRELDFLTGDWTGVREGPDGTHVPARMWARRVLGGCGILTHLTFEEPQEPVEVLILTVHALQRAEWMAVELDSREDTGFQLRSGSVAGDAVTLATYTPVGEQPGDEGVRTSWRLEGDELVHERESSRGGPSATALRVALRRRSGR